MEDISKSVNYPLLGEPKLMFEDDNIYVISELAEEGKTYSFVCPHCHSVFLDSTLKEEVKMTKCPDCDTFICFSSKGKKKTPTLARTKALTSSPYSNQEGVLIWKDAGMVQKLVLNVGNTIIGRRDEDSPSDISLMDETASRRSVRITVTKGKKSGKYTFKLEVLRTTNAVYVNRNALYAKSSIYLNDGDRFKVGKTLFTLVTR